MPRGRTQGVRRLWDSGVLSSLQRYLRAREKRMAELVSQLDALKVIDQDMPKEESPAGNLRY
jgi:hypothetical protein